MYSLCNFPHDVQEDHTYTIPCLNKGDDNDYDDDMLIHLITRFFLQCQACQ